jgi:DNA helicase-2/ATP-dependent DNA helicase PcrA
MSNLDGKTTNSDAHLVATLLLKDLTRDQRKAVQSGKKRLLLIAGAGSGKTEVMARRVGWWVGVNRVAKESIVAFTFTEKAAEEMKFRIREKLQTISPPGSDATLGGMYVGTIHSFCLKMLRELRPARYHNFDVLTDMARIALVQRGYHGLLGLAG